MYAAVGGDYGKTPQDLLHTAEDLLVDSGGFASIILNREFDRDRIRDAAKSPFVR